MQLIKSESQKSLIKLFLVFVSYVYIFQPPVVSKLLFVLLWVVFSAFVALRHGLPGSKGLISEISIIAVIIFYPIILDSLSSEIVYSDRFIYWALQSFVFGYFLVVTHIKNNVSLVDSFFWASFVAAIITMLAFFVPDVDGLIVGITKDPIYDFYSAFEIRYRAYGFSEHLTATYGAVMGFFAAYAIMKTRERVVYIFTVPIFLFAAFVNARTGVVIFILCAISLLITNGFRFKFNLRLFLILFSAFLLGIYWFNSISDQEIADLWYFSFLLDLGSFIFEGERTGNLNALFGDFLIFPTEVTQILFGTGKSLFALESGESDLGFVLQINYAGIIYTLILYAFIFYCYARLVKAYSWKFWYSNFFAISFLLINFKGFFFAGIPGARLLISLYLFFLLANKFERHPHRSHELRVASPRRGITAI